MGGVLVDSGGQLRKGGFKEVWLTDGSWAVGSKKKRSSFCSQGVSGHQVGRGGPLGGSKLGSRKWGGGRGHEPGLHLLFS